MAERAIVQDPLEPMMHSVLAGKRRWWVEHGNSLYALRCLPDECIDSYVSDPPAGISFMGRAWDGDFGGRDRWIDWLASILREVYRVLKPGAHAFVWALPRTSHWTGMAIEQAGFEIRDSFHHLFSTGFPKSLNVSKEIDRAAGAKREAVRPVAQPARNGDGTNSLGGGRQDTPMVTAPATDAAREWNGWGTAAKPAHEVWWLARKPLCGTVVTNVLEHGTGALNIDACRVAHASAADLAAHEAQVAAIKSRGGSMGESWKNSSDLSGASDVSAAGRWPANLLLSHTDGCRVVGARAVKANPTWDTPSRECESTFTGEEVSRVRHAEDLVLEYECVDGCVVRELDGQSGVIGQGRSPDWQDSRGGSGGIFRPGTSDPVSRLYDGAGPASRFFHQFQRDELDDITQFLYAAKPARGEKESGLDDFSPISGGEATGRVDGSAGTQNPRAGSGRTGGVRNVHPTAKGRKLMQHLCRLITPPGGIILDTFAGSGTTGVAAVIEGFRFIGVEMSDTEKEPFVSISRARLAYVIGGAVEKTATAKARSVAPRQGDLFR